ncbi:hypothetical protein [Pontibacter harenae]|uniref:hypothetical protein n=1 Tax=Pontibacter harenae TaxID=2894083 RepID=UPI001E42B3FE|nr:hypothetical protein [Pontibacter harenae]MCC9168519.1 hypothetical protein [Pontibacter harenae]
MNRYLFWILMFMPWFWLIIYLKSSVIDVAFAWIFFALVVYLCLIINVRRKSVGLSVSETFKAFVPMWGWREYRILFFEE